MLAADIIAAALQPAFDPARGEVFFPLGHVVALVAVLVAARVVKIDLLQRVVAVFLAVAVGLAPYFGARWYVPKWIAPVELAWFLAGFVPSAAVAGGFLAVVAWRERRRRKAAAPQRSAG